MKKDVLYVSDLDGTLMRSDGTLSPETVRMINALTERGVAFTYATARSIESARTIAGGLNLPLPAITRNGCVLADNATGKHLEKALFTEEEIALLKTLLPELPEFGFVSCFIGEEMVKTYLPGKHTPGFLYERVRQYDCWETLFQKDTYWDEYWVEICPRNCTKAKAILKMKETYGFRKLVVFGDSVNDLSMFRVADEAYAVEKALDELKAAATEVIGSNDDDAVAKKIMEKET